MFLRSVSLFVLLGLLSVPALSSEESKSYLPWFGAGFYGGSLVPLNSEFQEQSSGFAQLGVLGTWQIHPLTAMLFELSTFQPDGGTSFSVGFQQNLLPTAIAPFAGAGVGFRYLSESSRQMDFGERFGPLLSGQAGVLFFRESTFQVRLRTGYEFCVNKDKDQSWTSDIALIFALGRPGIRKLNL